MDEEKIILIGAGNVAHHLAEALLKEGLNLCQIYSRTPESARELGAKTGIAYTSEVKDVYPDGDVYIFCVSDDSLPGMVKAVRMKEEALVLHTSGSQPMAVLKPGGRAYGVMYPVQTFSKRRTLDFREIPLCVEGCSPEVLERVKRLAGRLSDHVREVDSARRKVLHLAAVLVNNFPNYLYAVAGQMMEENGLPFDMLRPLILETADKVMQMSPREAQTGPAKRGDESILGMHRAMLKDRKELLNVYALLSEGIRELYAGGKEETKTGGTAVPVDMPTLW